MSSINIKKCLLLLLSVGLAACSHVDDYLLGKDNTPKPKLLEPVTAKVELVEKWSILVGSKQKNTNYLKLKPVIIGDAIYSVDNSGHLQASKLDNGEIVWAKKLSVNAVSGPAIAAGIILVATDDSTLIAFKQSDGTELWQAKVSADVLARPLIFHDRVLVKTVDGNVYAFNLNSGEKLWVADHGSPSLILKASSSPVILQDKIVLVGYSDGKMDALDLASGQVLWQRSIAYASGASDVERLVDIDANPIVRNNIVLLGSYQGYVGALSMADGQFVWRKPASIYKDMTIYGNTLYTTDSNDIVWAINYQTGQVNWKQMALRARNLTEPVVVGHRVFVADQTGLLHILNTETGEFLARISLKGPVSTAPLINGNHVYVLTTDGKLTCYAIR